MRYRKPDYFEQFKCIADKCPDTCCSGWQIVIDESSLDNYQNIDHPFADKLRDSIDFEEGCYLCDNNRRCLMLNSDNLCEQVLVMGEESLCDTCHLYPRHVEEFEGLREWSLSPSCPVAVHMILSQTDKLSVEETEDDLEDPLLEEFEDFDYFLFTQLEDARIPVLDMATDSSLSVNDRMRKLYLAGKEMQSALEENNIGDIAQIAQGVNKMVQATDKSAGNIADILNFDAEYYVSGLEVLYELEQLNVDWEDYLDILRQYLEGNLNDLDKKPIIPEHEIYMENLLVAFLYTWFLGAVYDDEINAKILLSIFCVKMIEVMVLALKADGREDSIELWEDVTRRFLREVEHSEDNLILLEEKLV